MSHLHLHLTLGSCCIGLGVYYVLIMDSPLITSWCFTFGIINLFIFLKQGD